MGLYPSLWATFSDLDNLAVVAPCFLLSKAWQSNPPTPSKQRAGAPWHAFELSLFPLNWFLHNTPWTQSDTTIKDTNTLLPFPRVTEQALPKYTHPKRRIQWAAGLGSASSHTCAQGKAPQEWAALTDPLLQHTQKALSRPYFWEKRVSLGWIFWFHQAEGTRDEPQGQSLELNLRQSLQKLPEHPCTAAQVTDSGRELCCKHNLLQMLNTASLGLMFWVFFMVGKWNLNYVNTLK